MFGGRQKDLLAIDIGSSSVKLVQLKESKDGYQLVNVGMKSISPEAIVDGALMDSSAIVDAIQELVSDIGVKIKEVATAVSGHSVIIRNVNLPIMTEEELDSSIQWEAEQYIPFEISDVNIDFHIIGPDEDEPSEMKVVIVAAKKEIISDYVAVFKDSGLKPIVIDVGCFAMENAIELNYPLSDDIVALVDVGDSTINVNVLQKGMTTFTRDIQSGGKMFVDEMQKRLGASAEDAAETMRQGVTADTPEEVKDIFEEVVDNLAQEIQRSIDFFTATASDEYVTQVYLSGGVSQSDELLKDLSERLDIPVDRVDPFKEIGIDYAKFDKSYIESLAPYMSVAVGLAVRRLAD